MIVEDYPPGGGGGGIFVKEISLKLNKKYNITVITRGEKDHDYKQDRITVKRISGNRITFILRSVEYLLKEKDFDLYHAHGSIAGVIAKKVNAIKKKPVILHIHGYRDKKYAGIVKHSVQNLILKSKFDWIISSDNFGRKKIKGLGVKKVTTVSNGIDYTKLKKSKTKKNIFLFVGRLEKVKNPLIMLNAVKSITRKNFELWIVGTGSLEYKMKSYCKKNKLNNVKFFGYVDHNKLGEIYYKSKFFILPSLSEGHPIVALEAMASGLPIIVSDIPSLKQIVMESKAGIVFKNDNYRDLAKKIDQIMGINTGKMRKNSRKYVEKNFSWEKTSDKIDEIYKKVLKI